MKIFNQIRDYFDQIKTYLENEKEVLRLKVIKSASQAAANLVAVIFIIILFHIMLAMVGIWFGFYLSEVLGSYPMGFGLSALAFVILLIIIIVFRKPLLVNPFVNAAIRQLVNQQKLRDEDKKS